MHIKGLRCHTVGPRGGQGLDGALGDLLALEELGELGGYVQGGVEVFADLRNVPVDKVAERGLELATFCRTLLNDLLFEDVERHIAYLGLGDVDQKQLPELFGHGHEVALITTEMVQSSPLDDLEVGHFVGVRKGHPRHGIEHHAVGAPLPVIPQLDAQGHALAQVVGYPDKGVVLVVVVLYDVVPATDADLARTQ